MEFVSIKGTYERSRLPQSHLGSRYLVLCSLFILDGERREVSVQVLITHDCVHHSLCQIGAMVGAGRFAAPSVCSPS